MRRVLYMTAVTPMRCNRVFPELCGRLVAAGTSKEVALTACMRKPLVTLNAGFRAGIPREGPIPLTT